LRIFGFDKVSGIARHVRVFLNLESGIARDVAADARRHEERAEDPKRTRRPTSEQRKRLKSKKRDAKQELRRIRNEARAAKDDAERIEHKKRKKTIQQDIFELTRELRAADEGAAGEPHTGALPDFVIIGTAKGGTTSLYHLLTQHPYVEAAAAKELHFFDNYFDEGVEWYRRCFPPPKWKDGRWTITGEATPCLGHPDVPERVAKVIPHARLLALLRNPVDRAYSMYHHRVRNGHETRAFEDAIEEEAWLFGTRCEEGTHLDDPRRRYLSRGVYVDQLLRWSEFFSKEQLLVLKSEDLFERPQDTFRLVFDFLDLPDWEPETWKVRKKGGKYEQKMDSATRKRLEEYFEPHNRRLYEFLGVDFGW
jgi:hypothetical protein